MGNKHTNQNEINIKDINSKDNDLSILSPKKYINITLYLSEAEE